MSKEIMLTAVLAAVLTVGLTIGAKKAGFLS